MDWEKGYYGVLKKGGVIFLCLIMALATVRLPLDSGLTGDTNGDHQVDVRDLQVVIAQVLGGGVSSAQNADVNSDGKVDICDYQYILDQAGQSSPGDPGSDSDSAPKAVTADRMGLPMYRGDVCLPPASIDQVDSNVKIRATQRGARESSPAETRRYTFTLIPHAPPKSIPVPSPQG